MRLSLFYINLGLLPLLAWGKTSQPFYEDPFDLASGGASLTWATQEGILISNPALLPYGGTLFRWAGEKTTVSAGKESIAIAQKMAKGTNVTKDAASTQALLDTVFDSPVHVGLSQALSLITNNGGFAAVTTQEPDVHAWKYGDPETGAGTPTVQIHGESYTGGIASLAGHIGGLPLSFGISAKYVLVKDFRSNLELVDPQAVQQFSETFSSMVRPSGFGRGMGLDAGSLLFLQGSAVDFRLASTVTNIGGVALQGSTTPASLPQYMSAGAGVTFHNELDALHLAVDVRDLTNVYHDPTFKRIYAGAKLLLRRYIGLGAGLYQGHISYGGEIDLWIFRLAATSYTREYGNAPGVDPRPIYSISLSMGITL